MNQMTTIKKTLRLWMLLVVTLNIVSCVDLNDNPAVYRPLDEVLAENKLLSDIEENPDTAAIKRKAELNYLSQYSMYILQPVNHNQPDGDKFKQKVCILFRGYDRPTIMVPEGYYWYYFEDVEDIGMNLNANMVHVEHRNFGESCNQDQGKWEYETSAQASADLHAVYQALKPIFKGKWMSAGTSKGGETAMDYAYYYPDDMDLAAAFCSPFILSLADKRFSEYLFNEAGTQEQRDIMKKNIRKALENGEKGLYQLACDLHKEKGNRVPSFAEYVSNCFITFYMVFHYTLPSERQEILEMITQNDDKLARAICNNISDDRISEPYLYTYYVECAKEQGFPDTGYDYFADVLEGTSFKPEEDFRSSILSACIVPKSTTPNIALLR
jgi:hypothetical protein